MLHMIELTDAGILAFTDEEIALLESIRQGRTNRALSKEADAAFTAFGNNNLVRINDETGVVTMTGKGDRVLDRLHALRTTP